MRWCAILRILRDSLLCTIAASISTQTKPVKKPWPTQSTFRSLKSDKLALTYRLDLGSSLSFPERFQVDALDSRAVWSVRRNMAERRRTPSQNSGRFEEEQ